MNAQLKILLSLLLLFNIGNAHSNTWEFIRQTPTPLHQIYDDFDFSVRTNGDIIAIKKSGTQCNSTEIRILSASSGYTSFSGQTGSALHATGSNFDFVALPNNNIAAIKKSGTESQRTEVHILAAHGRNYGDCDC